MEISGIGSVNVSQTTYDNVSERKVIEAVGSSEKAKIAKDGEMIPTLQEKSVIEAIEKANKKMSGQDIGFEFSVHEKTKQIVVKILNTDTKEVIREIPSEKILDMVASMCEMAGLFVDQKR